MYIYNTTFLVSDDSFEKWIDWVKKYHIPNVMNDSSFKEVQLVKVLNNEAGSEKSFSLQFKVESIAYLDQWMKTIEPKVQQDLMLRFGTEVLFFSTILEIL